MSNPLHWQSTAHIGKPQPPLPAVEHRPSLRPFYSDAHVLVNKRHAFSRRLMQPLPLLFAGISGIKRESPCQEALDERNLRETNNDQIYPSWNRRRFMDSLCIAAAGSGHYQQFKLLSECIANWRHWSTTPDSPLAAARMRNHDHAVVGAGRASPAPGGRRFCSDIVRAGAGRGKREGRPFDQGHLPRLLNP
jgi:hypothetical protein